MPRKRTEKIEIQVEEIQREDSPHSSRRFFSVTISVEASLLTVPDRMAELKAIDSLAARIREGVAQIIYGYVSNAEEIIQRAVTLTAESGTNKSRRDLPKTVDGDRGAGSYPPTHYPLNERDI